MQALLMCDTLSDVLAKTKTLCVHSVFEHACNLQTETRELITLQTFGMPLAPRGCILPCDDLLELFEQGERVVVSCEPRLIAVSCEVCFDEVVRLSLRLKCTMTLEGFVRLKGILDGFLPKCAPVNGMYEMLQGRSSIFPAFALMDVQAAIQGLGEWLVKPDLFCTKLEENLRSLVGFGAGLTPSADDFLVGVLLVMDALKVSGRHELITALTPLLSRTTDVSKAMLEHASEGRYGAQLIGLFCVEGDLDAALSEVVEYGHSSGHDMLCGVAFALTCMLPVSNI